jgi:hypothetical protein
MFSLVPMVGFYKRGKDCGEIGGAEAMISNPGAFRWLWASGETLHGMSRC